MTFHPLTGDILLTEALAVLPPSERQDFLAVVLHHAALGYTAIVGREKAAEFLYSLADHVAIELKETP